MAEIVQARCEEMMPELERMEKLKLFNKAEIRSITTQRRQHEYKLQKNSKCKDDYLEYIQYEMDLLKLIRAKRQLLNMSFKKNDFESRICNRIFKIFHEAVSRFSDDAKLWLSIIKFCKQERLFARVNHMLDRMLQAQSANPSMFKLAADWEFKECGCVEKARQILQKGIRLHPSSAMLYSEAFHLELFNAKNLRKKKADDINSEQSLTENSAAPKSRSSQHGHDQKHTVQGGQLKSEEGVDCLDTDLKFKLEPDMELKPRTVEKHDKLSQGRLAEIIYETAFKKLDDIQFFIDLLSTASEFNFTYHLQKRIINDLLMRYSNDERFWDAMARRELIGLSFSDFVIDETADDSEIILLSPQLKKFNNKPPPPSKEQIRLCSELYQGTLKQIHTELMWTLYLETLIELHQDTANLPRYKTNLLLAAFQGAHSDGLLQEKFYLQWVDILEQLNHNKKIGSILKKATERLASEELFLVRLRFLLAEKDDAQAQMVFEQAITKFTNSTKMLCLWETMLQYYELHDSNSIEQVFKQSLQQGPEVSGVFKPKYLDWIARSKGIEAARKLYKVISIQPPFSLELHTKMVKLEALQPELNVKQSRKCFELACDQFGKSNADVWLDYIEFEAKSGNAVNIPSIHWRAVKALEPSQADVFQNEYNLRKTRMEC